MGLKSHPPTDWGGLCPTSTKGGFKNSSADGLGKVWVPSAPKVGLKSHPPTDWGRSVSHQYGKGGLKVSYTDRLGKLAPKVGLKSHPPTDWGGLCPTST